MGRFPSPSQITFKMGVGFTFDSYRLPSKLNLEYPSLQDQWPACSYYFMLTLLCILSESVCFNIVLLFQDKEHELALQRHDDDNRRTLKEKESEMMMAIEERELQKMAAVSAQDNQKDELQRVIDEMKTVSIMGNSR